MRHSRLTSGWFAEGSVATRLTRRTARKLLRTRDLTQGYPDLARVAFASILLIVGLVAVASAGMADTYLHRGVETGEEVPVVVQPTTNDLATNVDLTLFPPAELPSVATTLRESGFKYVRQSFSWRMIEPERERYDWTVHDAIVDQLARQNIRVLAVVHDAPAWSHGELPAGAVDGPPSDVAAFGTFVQALTARYQDRLPFIQVWSAPNDPVRWGGQSATGKDFLPLLAAGFNAANAGYPEVKILTPELASGSEAVEASSDLVFLESLYAAGGASFFDILGARVEGGQRSPEDRRVSPARMNFSRAILFRELMIRVGDPTTPVWATTFGWAAGGEVSANQQAAFAVDATRRAWAEWPWMGPMFHWAFVAEPATEDAAYAMVDADGRAEPLYLAITDEDFALHSSTAETGFAPMDSGVIGYQGLWQKQHLEGRTFQTTSQLQSSAIVNFQGTGLIGFVRFGPGSGLVRLAIDGEPIRGGVGSDGMAWTLDAPSTIDLPLTLVSNLDDATHQLTITLVSEGELTLGGLVVVRNKPFLWPVMLLATAAAMALFFAIRSLLFLVALRSGRLQRRSGVDLWPQLPRLPDWRPSRRI